MTRGQSVRSRIMSAISMLRHRRMSTSDGARVRASSRQRSRCSLRSAWSSRLPTCRSTCDGHGLHKRPRALMGRWALQNPCVRQRLRRSLNRLSRTARPHGPHQHQIRLPLDRSPRARPPRMCPRRGRCRSLHRPFRQTASPTPRRSSRPQLLTRLTPPHASGSMALPQRGPHGSAHPLMLDARSRRLTMVRCSGSRRRGCSSA